VLEAEEKFQPRYVEVPALRERGFGKRNLVWGVVFLILAIGLLIAAVILSGQKAVLSLAACMLTFTALYVLSRMHIFRQRNGSFLAVSIVVLLGGVVALLDRGYEALAGVGQSAPTKQFANGDPSPRMAEVEPPLLMDAFALSKPDMAQTQVRVLKDSRVVIDGKSFQIKKGDAFPVIGMKGGEATFAVRDLQVTLPVEVVEILGGKVMRETKESAMAAALAATANAANTSPAPTAPAPAPANVPEESAKPTISAAEIATITRAAQVEAMRRYPALSIKGSPENEIFVATYQKLKEGTDKSFFASPQWPLLLADQLAASNGWPRSDMPAPAPAAPAVSDGEPAPMTDAPASAPGSMDDTLIEQLPPSTLDDLPVPVPASRGRR
jgi:hypothetical protein